MNQTAATTARIRIELPAQGEYLTVPVKDSPHPATELFELRAAVTRKKKPATRHPAFPVREGSAVVLIHGRSPGPYTIAYRREAGGKRYREMRSDFGKAKKRAKEIATDLANGETVRLALGPADLGSYMRAREISLPTGKPLELVAAEHVEATQLLNGRATIREAVKYFIENCPADISNKTVPEIVAEMTGHQDLAGEIGERWADSLKGQLKKFAAKFQGPLHTVRAAAINDWLREQGSSPHTRLNYRGAVLQLVRYARGNGHLPATWDELTPALVPVPKLKQIEIKILTPEQLVSLLAVAPENLVPFLCIAAFAGVRHEEMASKSKPRLDWRDIDLEAGLIYIPIGVAKKGEDRDVPMSPNLVAWLKPYAQRNGPICDLRNASNSLTRAKKKAKLPAGKNETRNTLRKSFISYRKQIIKNIAQVADEAGNSVAKIKSNYKKSIPVSEAKRWFDIWPTTAGVIQLPLFG
ncbi:MAG: hypothetical protein JWQ04_2831 [Pedosphaera sp.]|nr:hypothetical protein [Pedosphaera sp.]